MRIYSGAMRDSSQTLASVRDVSLRLGDRQVLDHVTLELASGEIVTLIGPNGSGKTTLVRLALGLIRPDSGSSSLRPGVRIGYMPQRMVVDPVLPLDVRRFLLLGGRSTDSALKAALDEVGAAHLVASPIQDISGGEMQRVMLARALLRQPDMLVLDEPVQGVDVNGQAELYELIGRIRDRHGCGILMVSHDLHLVMASTDRVVCINHHVCCSGTPEVVTRDPAYLELFGPGARAYALYTHHHDHAHDLHGDVVNGDRVDGGQHG